MLCFNPLFIGSRFVTRIHRVWSLEDIFDGFNPLFIGSRFVTRQLADWGTFIYAFQSPIHRV